MIIEQQNKNSNALKFNPKAALFLANRFDAVEESSREKVKEHILNQLGKHWPDFDKSMTVFFSTRTALRDVAAHPDYVNDDYKKLLNSLSNLFSLAVDRRIRASYKWIEIVLQRLNHFLKATVTRLGMSHKGHQEKAVLQQAKLQKLKDQSDRVIGELMADIAERSEYIVRDVQKFLSKPQAKYLLCSVWKEDEIPKLEEKITDMSHWRWVKERIDDAFYDRLCNAIETWDDEESKVSSIETEIVENIKSKLGVLHEEISEIEHEMRSSNSSDCKENQKATRRLSIMSMRGQMIDEPLKLSLHMQHRVTKNPLENMKKRKEAAKFQKDPHVWARKRADKLMTKLLHNRPKSKSEAGLLTQLVEQLMQRPRDIVQKLEQRIPRIIDTNIDLLDSIQEMIVSDNRDAHSYEKMMVRIEGLKESLMNYGEGYIFVNDFKSNELKVLQETPTGQSLAQTFRFSELVTGGSSSSHQCQSVISVPHGLWTIVRPGTLQRDSEARPVSIKMYMPSSGVSHTFQEVAKLRCLLHMDVNLAEFLGIHHTEAVTPAYIFDGHLQSLHQYINETTSSSSQLPRLFKEIAEGVNYLHTKGMVHMELNKSTVTVTERGNVRMTGACVPRHATLPLDEENTVSEFVYLAPEVLRKELYVTSADIYGYGLLVYELLSERKAFKEQRKYTFRDFVERVDPVNMLHLKTRVHAFLSEEAVDLVSRCVEPSDGKRPNMNVVVEILDKIKDKFKQEGTGRFYDMHTPREVFRRAREIEKNTH